MNWYVLIQQYMPVAPDRCVSRSWFFPAPFPPENRTWMYGLLRRVLAPFVPLVLPFYIRKIFNEDNSVCERIQTVAHQIDGFPILSRHEQRIAWFEEVYAEAVGGRPPRQAVINTLVHDREARTGEQPKAEPRRQQAQ